jgi:diguanylate cyclase (GGDEF)-like protein
MQILEREFSRYLRAHQDVSLLLFDLDHFKKVNDTYGHDIGDVVLRLVGDVCRATLRTTDSPARLGGEEFAILLPETDLQGGIEVAERIRTALAERVVPTPKGDLKVTTSIGVTTFLPEDVNGEVALKRADDALYVSKHNGRNRVSVSSVH